MIIILVVYLIKSTKRDFSSDQILDLLENDKLFWNDDDQDWLCLVRPVSIFAPAITFSLVPTMLLLEIVKPSIGSRLNKTLLWLNDFTYIICFRA